MANRLILLAAAAGFLALAVAGCEDNPDQIFKRAPAGAANRWNDGKTPGTYDEGAFNKFTDSYNSRSKQELCSGPEKQQKWAEMLRQPIRPPRFIAGIDLAGSDKWEGLDFRDAERSLCQSKAQATGDAELLGATWGDGNEVRVQYLVANNTIDAWQLYPGYVGTMEFESRPHDVNDKTKPNRFGSHKYSVGIGRPVMRDGRNFEIEWSNPCSGTCEEQITELYDALMWTFDPTLPSTQDSCVRQQTCLTSLTTSFTATFGVRAIGVYMVFPNYTLPQPQASSVSRMYGFYVKLMPFSAGQLHVKLDDEGPTSTATDIGDLTPKKTCRQRLGIKFGEFLDNCINISSRKEDNDLVFAKLEGGMTHTKEAFNFGVEAVKLDFLSNKVGEDKTIGDDDRPTREDEAYELEMDIRASGAVRNDWSPDGSRFTFGGTGAIYREYGRRVQDDIRRIMSEWDAPRERALAPATVTQPASRVPETVTTANDGTCPEGSTAASFGCIKCPEGWTLSNGVCLQCASGSLANGKCIACAAGSTAVGEQCTQCPSGFKENAAGKCQWVGVDLGDKSCLNPTPRGGCTGFETFVTPSSREPEPGISPDVQRFSVGPRGERMGFKTALKAGDPAAKFCSDPPPSSAGKDFGEPCAADGECWSGKCIAAPDGAKTCDAAEKHFFRKCYTEKILSGSHKRVLDVLGGGRLLNLPPQLRDRKFYFKHWAEAIVKYLKAAGSEDPALRFPTNLAAPEYMPGGHACDARGKSEPWGCEPEPDHLLFDEVTPGLDKFEYIDRRYVDHGHEPLKVEYEILINTSNQQVWKFHRKLTRPERALYHAMSENKSDPPAGPGDNVRLTNLVGSPIIRGRWGTSAEAHRCASTLLPLQPGTDKPAPDAKPDPTCAAFPPPPKNSKTGKFMLDEYGYPLFKNYKGAFTGTAFSLGTSFIKMKEELPFIKSARVVFPFFADPYAPPQAGAVAGDSKVVLVDWRPKTPANGIRIPVNEQLDKFIPSATVVLGGSSLTLDMDYAQQPDGSMKLESVQSDNYMGNIFLCYDAGSGDLLSIEQYESMDVIQAWLNDHPAARSSCEILTRFSAFGDYPMMFAAKKAGVVLNVGLGSGVGRITSIEVYDPSIQ